MPFLLRDVFVFDARLSTASIDLGFGYYETIFVWDDNDNRIV